MLNKDDKVAAILSAAQAHEIEIGISAGFFFRKVIKREAVAHEMVGNAVLHAKILAKLYPVLAVIAVVEITCIYRVKEAGFGF